MVRRLHGAAIRQGDDRKSVVHLEAEMLPLSERPLRGEDQTGFKCTRPIRSNLCPEIGSEYRWRRVYHSI